MHYKTYGLKLVCDSVRMHHSKNEIQLVCTKKYANKHKKYQTRLIPLNPSINYYNKVCATRGMHYSKYSFQLACIILQLVRNSESLHYKLCFNMYVLQLVCTTILFACFFINQVEISSFGIRKYWGCMLSPVPELVCIMQICTSTSMHYNCLCLFLHNSGWI